MFISFNIYNCKNCKKNVPLLTCSIDFNVYIWLVSSRVAQWKRAGPITQRSVDRNHALLRSNRLVPELERLCRLWHNAYECIPYGKTPTLVLFLADATEKKYGRWYRKGNSSNRMKQVDYRKRNIYTYIGRTLNFNYHPKRFIDKTRRKL